MIKTFLFWFRFCIKAYYNFYGLQTVLPVRLSSDHKLDWGTPLLYNRFDFAA